MEILSWAIWGVAAVLGFFWSLVWFLIAGWVSTLLQIAVLIGAIYFVKYGWQQAPAEIFRRTRSFGRFFWNWLRAREFQTTSDVPVREIVRVVRAKELGDINISTLLSLLMCIGLALVTTL
jgi:hypothetical protein